ncbi:MAG: polyphosphate kinase 1 [Firmicutes bacterium]|nr:polyphosphate kinase 1 [Bacillota bacterium]
MQNRDISWLRFNLRVLEQAENQLNPLLERLKFFSIATTNLDEFFMIRMGSLLDIALVKPDANDSRTKLPIKKQIQMIYDFTRNYYLKHEYVYQELIQSLHQKNIFILKPDQLDSEEKKIIKTYFKSMIFPLLSPQVIDRVHPFPHLESKKEHIGVLLKSNDRTMFGLVPIPSNDILFRLPGESLKFVFVKDIIYKYVDLIFDMFKIEEKVAFTVTRNADIQMDDLYEDSVDIRIKMKEMLKKRKRLAAVRLELSSPISKTFHDFFIEKLNIQSYQFFHVNTPHTHHFVSSLKETMSSKLLQSLSDTPFKPFKRYTNQAMIPTLLNKDMILTFPYDEMTPFLRLLEEAAKDPFVRSIKITIYRLARRAKIVDYLIQSAENGKEVTVIIELKARFDEQNNIDYSEKLEAAGCHVMYGIEGLKIHSKLCVITRQIKGQIQYFTQIGTGNYNEVTANLYTDFSLMTSHQGIGQDAIKVFQSISLSQYDVSYAHLLVAPETLKPKILSLIEHESSKGHQGYIVLKMNALTDVDIIEALVKASKAGVQIEMFVRGVCCLLPGIQGETDNIRVMSIVGRFLEHSRLFIFGKNYEEVYLGSSDLMTRNTERRIEILTPVNDTNLKMYLKNYITVLKKDHIDAKEINWDGSHVAIPNQSQDVSSQVYMMQHYDKMHPTYKKLNWIQKILKIKTP